jgi:ribosome-associated protein
MSDFENYGDEEEEIISKSQVKREMIALQKLGTRLMDVPAEKLKKFPLTEEMFDAIDEFHRIKSHEAQRRHMQFVGRQMRREDEAAIQKALDSIDSSSDEFARRLHLLEKWRDRLIDKSDAVTTEFMEKFEGGDHQHMRQLIRNARKERIEVVANGTGYAKRGPVRKLYLYIKTLTEDREL